MHVLPTLFEYHGEQPCAAKTLCLSEKQRYAVALVLRRAYVFQRNSVMLWATQPCAAETQRPYVFSTNGPTFSVLVMLRIEWCA